MSCVVLGLLFGAAPLAFGLSLLYLAWGAWRFLVLAFAALALACLASGLRPVPFCLAFGWLQAAAPVHRPPSSASLTYTYNVETSLTQLKPQPHPQGCLKGQGSSSPRADDRRRERQPAASPRRRGRRGGGGGDRLGRPWQGPPQSHQEVRRRADQQGEQVMRWRYMRI